MKLNVPATVSSETLIHVPNYESSTHFSLHCTLSPMYILNKAKIKTKQGNEGGNIGWQEVMLENLYSQDAVKQISLEGLKMIFSRKNGQSISVVHSTI